MPSGSPRLSTARDSTLCCAAVFITTHVSLLRGNAACIHICGRRSVWQNLQPRRRIQEPDSEFGLPEQRKYPMPDASHARNAKARASQMEHAGKLSAADKKRVDRKADKILAKSK